jgi:hypothetical protein
MKKLPPAINCQGIILILLTTSSIHGSDWKIAPQEPPPPDYWRATVGPAAGVSAAIHGAVGQIRGSPKEWGGGVSGFGKRAGSGFATHIVKNTIEFPVAALLHEDLRYHRSAKTSFGGRMGHALVSPVWTQKTTTGDNTVAFGRISGAFGSGLISRLWQPAAARTLAGGFASGGISLGAQAGTNVVREFWPRSGGSKTPPSPPNLQ